MLKRLLHREHSTVLGYFAQQLDHNEDNSQSIPIAWDHNLSHIMGDDRLSVDRCYHSADHTRRMGLPGGSECYR